MQRITSVFFYHQAVCLFRLTVNPSHDTTNRASKGHKYSMAGPCDGKWLGWEHALVWSPMSCNLIHHLHGAIIVFDESKGTSYIPIPAYIV